jgi:hypothetical protein
MYCADAVDAAAAGCRRSGDLYGGGNILLKAKNVFKGLQVGAAHRFYASLRVKCWGKLYANRTQLCPCVAE